MSADIHAQQAEFLKAQQVAIPETPRITRAVLLYLALTIEELGETLEEARGFMLNPADADAYHRAATVLAGVSKDLRFSLPPDHDLRPAPYGGLALREFFDGIVDSTYTLAGAANAAALPIREGFAEVHRSNMSKERDEHGYFRRDASGKVIKGSTYSSPDLVQVLVEHERTRTRR